MKRIITAAVLVLVLAVICIGTRLITVNTIGYMSDLLFNAEQNTDLKTAEKIETEWTKKQKLLKTYCGHEELDSISRSIALLEQHIKYGSAEDFIAECENAQKALKHFGHSEKLSWENIL